MTTIFTKCYYINLFKRKDNLLIVTSMAFFILCYKYLPYKVDFKLKISIVGNDMKFGTLNGAIRIGLFWWTLGNN